MARNTLFEWHRMIMRGEEKLVDLGRYRTHDDPMQVVSGPIHDRTVHFEAPPSSRVQEEMDQFLGWFNATSPGQRGALPTVTRAAIAHIHFESIHPFEDGNGRIGRAISEKALSQGFFKPVLTALAETILKKRPSYYRILERSNKHMDATNWVLWFMATVIEARRRTMARVEFLIEKTRLLDDLRGELNARQEKALLRVLREGPDGFKGGLSANNYMVITDAAPSTATRDLAGMVEKGALIKDGERKSTRYFLTFGTQPVAPVTVDDIDGAFR